MAPHGQAQLIVVSALEATGKPVTREMASLPSSSRAGRGREGEGRCLGEKLRPVRGQQEAVPDRRVERAGVGVKAALSVRDQGGLRRPDRRLLRGRPDESLPGRRHRDLPRSLPGQRPSGRSPREITHWDTGRAGVPGRDGGRLALTTTKRQPAELRIMRLV